MAYSYECERDGDKCIQRLFGYVRRTAPSPRTVDSPSMTLAQLVRARRGHNLPRQAASFYIAQTDIIRTIIPLCGFGHTEEWKWLPRRITRDGDPRPTPRLARIIVECAVLGAAVVPDRQRTNLPAESAGKLWLNGMRHQKIENRPRLGVLEPIERLRVIAYVERFAAGLRMGPHKRMRGLRLQVAGVAHLGCHLVVAGVTAVSRRTYLVVLAQFLAVPDIPGLDAIEHLFHRIG